MKPFYKLPEKCCGKCKNFKPSRKNSESGKCQKINTVYGVPIENDFGEECVYFEKAKDLVFF